MEDVAAGQWKFTDGKSWNRDQEIQVTCLDSAEEGLPRCVYEDQMTFIGEDLPAVFGGGGVETNQETSAECIDLCERTSGCKYWTWIMDEKVNCFLKKNLLSSERRPKHVSGSDPSACSVTSPVVTTPVTTPVTTTEQTAGPKYNENEINGKFKIMMGWDDKFRDPESKEYQDLANTIETDLEDMLRKERDLSEQVESFTVKVEQFRRGSVVCDFKVNYILKEAYIAIPFAIKPANITTAMGNSFKIKKGILFQRFLIAGGSFNASSPVDHCSSKGCSHKCNYDYSLEDYVCTCPPALHLASDGLTCLQEPEVTSRLPEIEVSFLPSDCLWSPWSDWSDCSVCGAPGKRERKRTIVVPEKNGGTCVGRDQEFVECNEICEATEAPVSTTQQPSVEIVTSVSVDTGVNGEGRQDSIDTTLPDEVTEKAMEDLEPETGMDIEADQPSETTTVTFTEETSGEVEQGEVQSTEEAEQTTETTTDNVKETDEGIIYPLPEIPTEAETTTLAEKEDVVMSTESMIEMTTEADMEITTAKEMDPIVQYTTTTKQVVDTSSETTMEDTATEKVARDGLDIEESMDTTTLASVSDAVIPMETTASVMEEDNADDIQTTTASIQEEVTDPAEVVASTSSASITESTEVEATSEINENETATKQDAPSETTTENQTVEDMTDGARNDLDISATVTTTLPSSTEGLSKMETDAGEVEVTSGEPTTISSSEENTSPVKATTEMTIDEAPVTSSVTESPNEMTPAGEEMETEATTAAEVVTELNVDEVTSTTEDNEAVTEKMQSKLPRIDTAAEMAMTTSPTIQELPAVTSEPDIESLSQVVEVTTPREDTITETTVKDEELTTVADVKMIMSADAEIKENSNTGVEQTTTEEVITQDMKTSSEMEEVTTEKVDMEENVEEVITEKNIMMEVTTEEDNIEEEKIMAEITTEKERMEEVTAEKESIEEVITEKESIQEITTEKESMVEITTEKESMAEITTEKENMVEITREKESMVEVTTEKESMVEVTTEDMKANVEEITTEEIMEPIPEEVTTEEVTKEEMETSEEVTTEKIIEMVETTSMEPSVEMTTVEVVAISEEEDELSLMTTVRPRLDESVVRTTVQPVGEDQEFLCHPAAGPDQKGDMPMSCVHLSGDEERSIMLLIPREVIGDISLNRLFDKNVKIVVRDFMVMDRSPRRL